MSAGGLAAALGREVVRLEPVAGGDLNEAYAATLADGTRAFVKTSAAAASGAFAAEAAGLRWLGAARAVAVPGVLAVGDREDDGLGPSAIPRGARPSAAAVPFLAFSWIDAGPRTPPSDEALGRGLAALHAAGAPTFGGPTDTLHIGPLTLPNAPAPDWPARYATRRLEPLARLAAERGALPARAPALLERVIARLPQLAGPAEPPARLHGDLWAGNVLVDPDERPWLVDPPHGGHRDSTSRCCGSSAARPSAASPPRCSSTPPSSAPHGAIAPPPSCAATPDGVLPRALLPARSPTTPNTVS